MTKITRSDNAALQPNEDRPRNITAIGTRFLLEVPDARGIANGNDIVFVPTGKTHKVVTKTALTGTAGLLEINPPIPIGKDWEAKLIQKADFDAAEIKVNAAAGVTELELSAASELKKGDVIKIGADEFTLADNPDALFKIKVTPPLPNAIAAAAKVKLPREIPVAANFARWTVNVSQDSGLDAGKPLSINGEEFLLQAKNGGALSITSPTDSGDPWKPGTSVRKLRAANSSGADKINVRGAAALYRNAIVELDNGENKEVRLINSIDGDTLTLATGVNNVYREGHKVRVIEAEFSARQLANGAVSRNQTFANLRLKDDKSPEYFLTLIRGQQDSLIDFDGPPLGQGFPDSDAKLVDLGNFPIALEGTWTNLEGGQENIAALSVDDFIGTDNGPGKRTGIKALEDIDEISICLAPGIWAPSVLGELIIHCETLKDRFAIVDPPDTLDIEGIRSFREPIDTKYAALYYPWLKVRDPLSKQEVRVAPSGHMAGVYARVDVERGVHKAPANEVVRGISAFAEDVTKREQDMLNPKNINAFRYFPGRGNRVWGARVLTSDSAWKYINVRRLFIFVEESIDEGTQWVVFEPNDEQLWGRVRQSISNFLETVWRSGALMGTKAQEAFFVKCDRSTMSQDDLDNGRLICLIGIAPVKPAEFVIFRIQQKTLNAANA